MEIIPSNPKSNLDDLDLVVSVLSAFKDNEKSTSSSVKKIPQFFIPIDLETFEKYLTRVGMNRTQFTVWYQVYLSMYFFCN